MSASANARLARLISRVADERAARGRVAPVHRPHVAPQRFRRREEDDAERRNGSQAEFTTFELSAFAPAKAGTRMIAVLDAEGREIATWALKMPTTVTVTRGIDYAGIVARYEDTFQNQFQFPVSSTTDDRLPKEDRDLIDILFPE